MFNKTHLEHSVISVGIQLVLALGLFLAFNTSVPVALLAGAFGSVALFLGREVAQHEYKLAINRGWKWGEVKPVKWYEGFTKGWSTDSVLDVLSPLGVNILVVILAVFI